MEPVERESEPVNRRRIDLLRAEFPEAWSEGKLGFDKLKEALGEFTDASSERYSFSWSGKRDALRILQTPTRGTLVPARVESVEFDETGNLFIEGDNLEVLKLLYKSYFRRVKLIYIDPPFNTGGDFIYPDNFRDPLEPYLKLVGDMDEEGNLLTTNPDTSGRFHSSWLSMMYPRLFIARQLLADDGAIFVEIDDNEVHNLRMIMNEIFGEENFVATIIWQKKFSPQNDAKWLSDNHDFILCYAKNKDIWRPNLLPRTEEHDSRFSNPDNDPRGSWSSGDLSVKTYSEAYDYPITTPSGRIVHPPQGYCWRVSPSSFEELVKDNRIWFGEDGKNVPRIKRFLSEVKQGITPLTVWTYNEVGHNQEAKQELKAIMEGVEVVFDTPKPVRLLERIIHLGTNSDKQDIVLDFFAGSCSIAHAVMTKNIKDQGNRQFICVQLPEPTGNSGYPTVADLGKERIRRAGKKLREDPQSTNIDTGFRVYELAETNYKTWEGVKEQTLDDYLKTVEEHLDPLKPDWIPENLVYELALKEGYPLTATIETIVTESNKVFKVSSEETRFYICLDKEIPQTTIDQLNPDKETLLVVRDKALTDTQAANLALQCNLKTL
jgi:adenine-specific DNA-methyltransferase